MSNTFFLPLADEGEIRREKAKARELRRTRWWANKCASGRCYYCDGMVGPNELTMDHVVPLVRGGKSTRGNIVPACKTCNSKKKYLLPMEWEEYLQSVRS